MAVLGQLNTALKGSPDELLTGLLIIVAVILVTIAIKGSPSLKAILAAWVIAP